MGVQSLSHDTSRFDTANLQDLFQSLVLSEICKLGHFSYLSSDLKRVKNYRRSTKGEARLNHLMLLHVHKELADGTDLVEVANLSVGDNHRRKHLFGKVSKYDLPMKSLFAYKVSQTVENDHR